MSDQAPTAAQAAGALKMLESMKSKLGGVLQQIGGAKRKLKKRRKSRRKSRKKKRGSKKRRKSRRKRRTKRRRRRR
tara:strand:- start:671 stop:898 length:228 start_codon:yes stop_codon:yes gene_type:complete